VAAPKISTTTHIVRYLAADKRGCIRISLLPSRVSQRGAQEVDGDKPIRLVHNHVSSAKSVVRYDHNLELRSGLCSARKPVAVHADRKCIRVNAPTWQLVRKSATCNRNLSYLKYQFGKSLVFVFIFPQKSLEEAAEAFDYLGTDEEFYSRKVEVLGSGWRNSKEKNRVWKAWSGETGVDLKKGKVVVRVSASTLNLSRQFGQYVGDALPDT